jgi:sugar (pentulose or hexulose) kinase
MGDQGYLVKDEIINGWTSLGIELGSTRIKAVLIGRDHKPLASGSFDWENSLENGIWTYPLADVWTGLQTAYRNLAAQVKEKYGVTLKTVGSMGFSGMMHGYLPFDSKGNQLVPFRTWRNTITEKAANELTNHFGFNIPQRWSIAHLYQAMLNGEEHIKDIDFLTTLAGYVHWKLTGQRVMGVGEASGMFPIDSSTGDYSASMMEKFDELIKPYGVPWSLSGILPKVLNAGEDAGTLTPEGAKLLDPTGELQSGIPLCPPEGDAGTGMVATNSIRVRTGNVSAGTSIFAMIVLEKELSRVYPEIDMVTTPNGSPVAMVHCNNCTSDLDAWVRIFGEAIRSAGAEITKPALYDMLYFKALEGDKDAGGLVNYNYVSGEPVTYLEEGRPLLLRMPDANFNLANFMRAQIYSCIATLKLGMDILFINENIRIEQLLGHGGLFKTKGVAQKFMSGALNVPVSVMETAGEGGPWGMAILAAYMKHKAQDETLEDYLDNRVFKDSHCERVEPAEADIAGFKQFMDRYVKGLEAEKAAVKSLR